MPRKKDYLKKHGIYPEAYDEFFKLVKNKFEKRKDLISQTRIRDETGKNPETIKKYLNAGVELGDIRPCDAYFIGCSPYELIVTNFGHGDATICPKCNKEVLPPTEGNEVVCNCGIHYTKQDTSKWKYKPRIHFLGAGTWKLESFSVPGEFYYVRPFEGYCSCAHHLYRGAYCKHLKHVIAMIGYMVCNKTILDASCENSEVQFVLTAVLRRLLDPRKKIKALTYRQSSNETEKIGLKLAKYRLSKIVSKFAEKQVLKKTRNLQPGTGHQTLISINQWIFNQFFSSDSQVIESYTQSFEVGTLEEKTSFLKVDKVENTDVMLPNIDFSVKIDVNYSLPKPTDIRLEIQDAENHEVTCSMTLRLNGEDVESFTLKPKPLGKKMWIPQVELYYLSDKKEWCLTDYYVSGHRIYSPEIRTSENGEGLFEVESFTEVGKFYVVDIIRKNCSCPSYVYHNNNCKHLCAVEKVLTTKDRP